MWRRCYLVCLFILLSSPARADVDETGQITKIIVEGSNIVSVWLSGTDATTECASGGRWTVSSSDLLFREKVSALLAAASSGKNVHLHQTTSWGCGAWNSNKIYYVDVSY